MALGKFPPGSLVRGAHEKAENIIFLHVGRLAALLNNLSKNPVHLPVGSVPFLERGQRQPAR